MDAKNTPRFDSPHQFEPLLPSEARLAPLLEKAGDLTRRAMSLGAVSGNAARSELRRLLRSMNSYYTNRIEGEHTRPVDIERALHHQYSQDSELARKQRLAVAHIRAEERCEALLDQRCSADGTAGASHWLYTSEALAWIHRELFEDLPEEDRRLQDGSILRPGAFRRRAVAVGWHEAPAWKAVPAFLTRWQEVYAGVRRGEASLVALAAAHHRLVWVHPFADGNGRVTRLHTHLLLHAWGLSTGLWSPLRGFARSEGRYKALLQAADEARRGDLDGRGNLTQAGLIDWIDYTLEICLDQVEFMRTQLEVHGMRDRLRAALSYEQAVVRSGVREESLMPLHYLFATNGELTRAEFKSMTGLGERVATGTLSALIQRGFLVADSPYGAVRFAIPRHALRFYFPALWPEAEQDAALTAMEPDVAAAAHRARGRKPKA